MTNYKKTIKLCIW